MSAIDTVIYIAGKLGVLDPIRAGVVAVISIIVVMTVVGYMRGRG